MHFLTLFWKILFAFIPPTGNLLRFYSFSHPPTSLSLTLSLTAFHTILRLFMFHIENLILKLNFDFVFSQFRSFVCLFVFFLQQNAITTSSCTVITLSSFHPFTHPYADIYGGYVCFVVSIFAIGVVTAVIGDVASHFGCTLGIKDSVTAIVFVALGTSVPGERI